jgi:hypothetical protein
MMRGAADREVVERLIGDASTAFAKLGQEGTGAALTVREAAALEAVIETDGSRPVLFVRNGDIDGSSELGDWGAVASFRPQIRRVIASIGRVDSPIMDPGKAGTVFMVAPGLAITARHVLEGLANCTQDGWEYVAPATVNFVAEVGDPGGTSFELGEVVWTGPDPINFSIDFGRLDVAIIRLKEGKEEFPRPLSFERSRDAYRDQPGRGPRAVQVIGFPGEPWVAPAAASGAPPLGHEYEQVIRDVFRSTFGVKRWAPGLVHAAPGELDGDVHGWVFSHDASTLAGSSGSAIVDLRDNGERVLGIHFGGRSRDVNWGHAFASLKDELPTDLGIVWPGGG